MTRVVIAVIRENGKYLIGLRRADRHFGGKWEFPGGKVEPGESEGSALKREIREELGVNVQLLGNPYQTESMFFPEYTLSFYRCTILDSPRLIEHDGLMWIADLPQDGSLIDTDTMIRAAHWLYDKTDH